MGIFPKKGYFYPTIEAEGELQNKQNFRIQDTLCEYHVPFPYTLDAVF